MTDVEKLARRFVSDHGDLPAVQEDHTLRLYKEWLTTFEAKIRAYERKSPAIMKLVGALQTLPLESFDTEDMGQCDAADFVDHAGEFFEAMVKARAALTELKGERRDG